MSSRVENGCRYKENAPRFPTNISLDDYNGYFKLFEAQHAQHPPASTTHYSILQNSKTDDPNALPPPSTHLPTSLA